ncbi:MAG: SH3 domain-containing protein [Selenomonadaceae bacterium]|nr:SH3 domain-containing protein [Selenomonadaceae bacterium]
MKFKTISEIFVIGITAASFIFPSPFDPPNNTYYVVNCNEWISLREYPDVESYALEHIPLGQAVTFLEDVGNGFYKINYDGAIGYALAAYLEKKDNNVNLKGRLNEIKAKLMK